MAQTMAASRTLRPLRADDRVRHASFGEGAVTRVVGDGALVVVQFESGKRRSLKVGELDRM
jgi:hypothetical protein